MYYAVKWCSCSHVVYILVYMSVINACVKTINRIFIIHVALFFMCSLNSEL